MEKGNGKIAIAIVAMFVVALSIVGVTYAYFVASVTDNSTEDVNVQAGVLSVAYTAGNVLKAENLVPGWESDGKHYFDTTLSFYTPAKTGTDKNANGVYDVGNGEEAAVDENGNIVKAVKAVSTADTGKTPCTSQNLDECTEGTVTYEDGISEGVTFTVTNSGTDTAYYGIRLIGVKNELNDQENFKITLTSTGAEAVTADLITDKPLADDNVIQPISAVISIPKTKAHTFKLNAIYANLLDAVQDSKGAKVEATVEVVGLTKVGEQYIAADGDVWSFTK